MTTPAASPINRRNVVKGAAWAVPAVTLAAATPAFAGSPIPPNGLNGWVEVRRSCWSNTLTIDGSGDYPQRGLWTFVPDQNATISGAKITFFININNLTFSNSSQNGWSNLVRDQTSDGLSPANGHFAYTATYTGGWTYDSSLPSPDSNQPNGGWLADGDPEWVASLDGCPFVSIYARRELTVNGETVVFTRGPVTFGFAPRSSGGRSAQREEDPMAQESEEGEESAQI